jgi:serine/threonine-protein kinase
MPDPLGRIESLYHAARTRPPEERDAFLTEACEGDDELRRQVESLLGAQATIDGSLGDAVPPAALASGARIGTYHVGALIGAGGMGEVYRARDSKLARDVAIKVLPSTLAADPDRLVRFRHEARLLAALNHPNVAQIHGLEESDGIDALVMELVEGDTLADRIAKGPVPLEEALHVAGQIVDALEAAHMLGIVHRDLKPANVKLRPDGVVKVLDFGLAKALNESPVDPSLDSTVSAVGRTRPGMVLGTAAYMSPEQARGLEVDTRTDVWALGCIVYETLVGRSAFGGVTVFDTIAGVLARDPEWQALPENTPASVRRLLRRCLQRDRSRRLADVRDARLELADASNEPLDAPSSPSRTWNVERLGWLSALVVTVLVAGAAVAHFTPSQTPVIPRAVTRTLVDLPNLATTNGTNVALSQDGRRIVYVGNGGRQLFVRALDALDPISLVTANQRIDGPFVSPDGQWVGFFEGGRLKKVPMSGGPAVELAPIASSGSRGATWTTDDAIVFATSSAADGLWLVSSSGGTPIALTHPDRSRGEAGHLWPERLPDGHTVLFTITSQTGDLDAAQIVALDVRTQQPHVVLRGGSHAQYSPSGHLIYTAAGALRAVAFDLSRLATRGTGTLVIPTLSTTSEGGSDFAVAGDGTLAYVSAPAADRIDAPRTLTWVDRTGKEQPLTAPPRGYIYPRLSPDGKRIALDSFSGSARGIWIWDLVRATMTRLTLDSAVNRAMEWTRDGQRIVYTSNRSGFDNLWWQAADGSGQSEPLTTSPNVQFASGTTPDGRALIFFEAHEKAGRDIMTVALDGTRRVASLLATPFDERNGIVSDDGHWLAYECNRSGRSEIYVRPFPNVAAGEWQVSVEGGTRPLWSHDGKELYYVALARGGALMRVPVDIIGGSLHGGTPVKLFDGYAAINPNRTYDVAPDGRFLMIKPVVQSQAAPNLVLVQHWDEELRVRVPADRVGG